MAHVASWKKDTVKSFSDLLAQYPIIGIVNMENLPTSQLQNMREQLRDTVYMKMIKKRLIKIAFEDAKKNVKGIEKLEPYLRGMPAILFTKENPFKLYKTLNKNKSNAPAKTGQTAPKDVIVPAGPTPFAPGPIIGELGSCGIKAGIDGGKVAVKEDKVVVKEGEVFSEKMASILTRLGIMPMEIGLDLVAVLEDGEIFTRKILAIDEDEYKNNITTLAREAFNLAMFAGILTTETTEPLVQKSFRDAKALALEIGFLTKETAGDLLAKSYRQMLSVASQLPSEAKDDELNAINVSASAPVASTESAPVEEKKEEKKEENAAAGLGALFG
ncbi:50S ribosomal protein L10 [Candidatus Woesearchaeota archaeon]|nr:50S ribosomal protein L10 [Candidatus Woesearchaeota archaeon]